MSLLIYELQNISLVYTDTNNRINAQELTYFP